MSLHLHGYHCHPLNCEFECPTVDLAWARAEFHQQSCSSLCQKLLESSETAMSQAATPVAIHNISAFRNIPFLICRDQSTRQGLFQQLQSAILIRIATCFQQIICNAQVRSKQSVKSLRRVNCTIWCVNHCLKRFYIPQVRCKADRQSFGRPPIFQGIRLSCVLKSVHL